MIRLSVFVTLLLLAPALATAEKVQVKVIKLSQGNETITVYFYPNPASNGVQGFWQAPKGDVGNDASSHNQWKWDQSSKTVKFYDDIGLRDTRGAGHDITFENSEQNVLTLKSIANPANMKSGDSGKGEKRDRHSRGIQGTVDWKCTGIETQNLSLK